MTSSQAARYVVGIASGVVLPLAFAPFNLYWLAPLAYAALFHTWRDAKPPEALGLGFAFGCASFGFGTYWTYIAVRQFGEAPLPIALLLTVGLVVVLSGFVALAGWLVARVGIRGPVAWLAAFPGVFVLCEWLRSWMFTGFGWLSAGYSQTDSWLMGYAPLGGVHAMSLAVFVTAGALLTLACGSMRSRWAAGGLLLAIWGAGFAAREHPFTMPEGRGLKVALVQGAIEQDLKWRPEQLPSTLFLYSELTKQSAGADLIVWPEAAIPTYYEYVLDYLQKVRRDAASHNGTVLLGTLRATPSEVPTDTFQNILVALTEVPQIYVKRHLVPFGEYYPVPDFIRDWIRLMNLPYQDAVPGVSDPAPIVVDGQRLAITICYEDVFGAEQLHYLPAATLLVNVSNDAWFGDSIAPHQHLQIARVRAAEAGRYLLRSTNTGLTAVVDPLGRVEAVLPQFEADVLTAEVQGYSGATPYAQVGNYAAVVGALALVVVPWVRSRRRVAFAS